MRYNFKNKLKKDVKVILPKNIYERFLEVQEQNKGQEWTFFSNTKVEKINNIVNITLLDWFIPVQENTATTTKTKGTIEEQMFFKDGNFAWCHSHHSMQPNPSAQDKSTTEEFVTEMTKGTFFVRIIMSYDDFNIQVYEAVGGFLIEQDVKVVTEGNITLKPIKNAISTKTLTETLQKAQPMVYKGYNKHIVTKHDDYDYYDEDSWEDYLKRRC